MISVHYLGYLFRGGKAAYDLNSMPLETLVLSQDAQVLGVLRPVLAELGLGVQTCTAADSAGQMLRKRKYDAVVIDCDVPGARPFLNSLRSGSSNRTSVIFVIINRSTTLREAFDLGANFVLDKPVTPERAGRTFRAAEGLMARERRRYIRHHTTLPVRLSFGDIKDLRGEGTNLSEGGMRVRLKSGLALGTVAKLKFELSTGGGILEVLGEVVWSETETCGIRFLHVAPAVREKLEQWLWSRNDRERSNQRPVEVGAG